MFINVSICLMSNGCVHTKLLLRLSLCSGLQIAKCSHKKNAFIPEYCWDKSGKYRLCGATRLDAGLSWPKRPLCAYYHTPALLTKAHSVAPTPLLSSHGFRLPSKVHSATRSLPHSHHRRLSERYLPSLLTLSLRFMDDIITL